MNFNGVDLPPGVGGYSTSVSERHPDTVQIEDLDGRKYLLVNPGEHSVYSDRYRGPHAGLIGLWFDQHAPVRLLRLLVWADGLESALEECAGWLSDSGLKGMFAEFSEIDRHYARKEVAEEQDIAPDEVDDGDVQEHLEVDHTYTESGLIPSEDWGDLFSPENNPAPNALIELCVAVGRALEEAE